jgi:hypothetical protein
MSGAHARKSRSVAKRRMRRAQQRILLAGGAAFALALTSALSIASLSGVDVAGAAIARAQSLADLFARRSPGERTQAHLAKTKHKHFAILADRVQPEIPPLPLETPLVEALLPPAELPPVPLEFASLEQAAAPAPALFAPAIGGPIFASCCGGPGGGGGPPSQPPPNQPPPNQPPAVPEPATWAMMIAGFGIAGLSLRRRRRQAPLQSFLIRDRCPLPNSGCSAEPISSSLTHWS